MGQGGTVSKKDTTKTVNDSGLKKLRVFEAFSGIGAQNSALKQLGLNYEIVGTSDWFVNAILAYDAIHCADVKNEIVVPSLDEQIKYLEGFTFSIDSQNPLKRIRQLKPEVLQQLYVAQMRTKNFGSMTDIDPEMLPEMDVLVYSFPCQDLSTGGNCTGMGKGSGTRSCMIWHVGRILRKLKKLNRLPEYLLMENVPAILLPRYEDDFKKWKLLLYRLGYKNETPFVLDASRFGIPQDRERLFMVSRLGTKIKIVDKIRAQENPWGGNIRDFLKMDYDNPTFRAEAEEAKLNLTPSRQVMWNKNKREEPFDKSTIIHTITCNMDRTQTAALFKYGDLIRRLTIREAFLLMGFTEDDYERIVPLGFTYRQQNKLIGNSIVVPVLKAIFKAMLSGTEYLPEGVK